MAGREQGKAAMRARLIEAAFGEFSSRGFGEVTTKAIAERAGCNEVTLFRHFGSKEALLEASIAAGAAGLLDACRLRELASGDLVGDLRRFAGVFDEVMVRTEGLARTIIGERDGIPQGVLDFAGRILESFHGALVEYLRVAQQRGVVAGGQSLELVAQSLTAMLSMAVLRRSAGHMPVGRDEWLEHVARLFGAALGSGGPLV